MTTASDISDFEWLISDAARPWLAEAAEEASASLVTLTTRFRRELSAARAHLVLEQAALRRRAREKFRLADAMFFTPVALEQATDETIARYKASRFPRNAAIADLCCGIGGDAIGLALIGGEFRGYDRSPAHGIFAAANVRLYLAEAGLPTERFAVEAADVGQVNWTPTAWHADPDRRASGRRTTAIEFHDPSTEVLERWLARQPAAAIKLAPAAQLPNAWHAAAECEWISRGGECRQLVAWFGSLAPRVGQHVATVLTTSEGRRQISGTPRLPIPPANTIGRYVYEPDAAILAARLAGQLANELGLSSFSPETAYLTGDRPVIDAAVAGFEVLDVLPFQVKKLKAYLRQHQAGHVEVKKRGVSCDPLALQKQLSADGSEKLVVLVTRYQAKSVAIVARRLLHSIDPANAAHVEEV